MAIAVAREGPDPRGFDGEDESASLCSVKFAPSITVQNGPAGKVTALLLSPSERMMKSDGETESRVANHSQSIGRYTSQGLWMRGFLRTVRYPSFASSADSPGGHILAYLREVCSQIWENIEVNLNAISKYNPGLMLPM
jgi:hypothetical protein